MWIDYNPNPEGRRTIDCTVRALCKALDLDWDTVHLCLCAISHAQKTMPSSNSVWGALLKRNGFRRYVVPDTCPDCYTAAEFCMDHPRGVYVLAFGEHVATVEDGDLYDAWNSLNEVPQFYWTRED
ncbi:MAG: hypothetical protein IJ157_04825 [Clostridia bacterium]|nr:hypothetical protein [Clostridia bacterium]